MWPGTVPLEGKVSVEGMTCMSCVNHIQDTIGAKEGILNCTVSLQEKTGNIYIVITNWDLRGNERALDLLRQMSFHSFFYHHLVCDFVFSSLARELTHMRNESISATVIFDGSLWNGESVAEAIDDMGFESKLISTKETTMEGQLDKE